MKPLTHERFCEVFGNATDLPWQDMALMAYIEFVAEKEGPIVGNRVRFGGMQYVTDPRTKNMLSILIDRSLENLSEVLVADVKAQKGILADLVISIRARIEEDRVPIMNDLRKRLLKDFAEFLEKFKEEVKEEVKDVVNH